MGSTELNILSLIDELGMGGAQTLLRSLLIQMKQQYGTRHRVVNLFAEGEIGESIRQAGFEVIDLKLEEELKAKRYSLILTRIGEQIQDFSPTVLEGHLSWSRILGLWAGYRHGVSRRFGFEHGDIFRDSIKWRTANFLAQFYATKTLVCSEALRQWCESTHGIYKENLQVVHNGVDPQKFKPGGRRQEIRHLLRIGEQEPALIAIGSLGKGVNKRVDVLIRGLARSELPAHLIVLGDGELRSDLERLTYELNLISRIHFLGNQSNVTPYLEAADLFCHAAPFEPFGLVCVEAMLMGLPTLVPDSGGLKEVVVEGKTGLLYEALNEGDFAQKLAHLLQDRTASQSMGLEGKKRAQEHFTIETYAKRLYEIYTAHQYKVK